MVETGGDGRDGDNEGCYGGDGGGYGGGGGDDGDGGGYGGDDVTAVEVKVGGRHEMGAVKLVVEVLMVRWRGVDRDTGNGSISSQH